VREVADDVGITERATLRILHDLVEAGYVRAERVGRRNRYRLRLDQPMRHPMEGSLPVGMLVEALRGTVTGSTGR
jgi:DNA-binding transcriptional ArsR family regulator